MAALLAHQIGSPEFAWAVVAELSLVVWTALLLLVPRGSGRAAGPWRFRLAGLAAALAASGVALAGKTVEVWPGNPLFPSGHTAYAVAIAVFLAVGAPRRLVWAVPLLALLAVALVLAEYHIVADIAGGLVVGLAVGAGASAGLDRWERAGPTRTAGA